VGLNETDSTRDNGFLTGFHLAAVGTVECDCKCEEQSCKDTCDKCKRVANIETTNGSAEGGLRATENLLLLDPSIRVIFATNGSAARGASEALKAIGKESDVLIVSIDGGCTGVRNVAEGVLGATAEQNPLLMASLGIEAIKKFSDTGERPMATEGKNFFDTGVSLVTDKPADSVPSINTKEGLAMCWG
jgi:fructose transport system substrate-binding protein